MQNNLIIAHMIYFLKKYVLLIFSVKYLTKYIH